MTDEVVSEMAEKYHQGLTLVQIASRYNTGKKTTVRRRFKALGVKIRPPRHYKEGQVEDRRKANCGIERNVN